MSSTTFIALLGRLVASGGFRILHERLTTFLESSYRNSCEENAAFCWDLIELQAKLQGQLFHLLELCCFEGGIYSGSEVLKNRLLPWLRGGSSAVRFCTATKYKQTGPERYEGVMKTMEEDLSVLKIEPTDLRTKFSQVKKQLEAKEFQVKQLCQETIELKRENSELHGRLHKTILETIASTEFCRGAIHPTKPTFTVGAIPLESRSAKIVDRFKELYEDDRLHVTNALKKMLDRSMAERMVFFSVEECFRVCKLEQHRMKSRMNQALQTNLGDKRVETDTGNDLVDKYVKKNINLYETETLISDVMKSLHRNSATSLHIPGKEKILVPFIREVLRVAWDLVSLDPPIDLPGALEGDVIDETHYRRAYDSEFSAATVQYFVWPALVRDGSVICKGEVVTKRLYSSRKKEITSSTPRPGSAEPSSSSNDLGFCSLSSSWKSKSFETAFPSKTGTLD
ncbi:mitochondria-eating protein-like [Montipora capricornis]|uniref:mitochondria-eating protein-like n=1 Tax=Montipora capricornis TaxID=246305 RepID=UPI0035F1350C